MSDCFAIEGTMPQTDAPALPSLLLSSPSQQYSSIPFLGMSSLEKKKKTKRKPDYI